MGMWKETKRPEDFPAKFIAISLNDPGVYTIVASLREADCIREQRRFSAFRSACRRFPAHRVSLRMKDFEVRTRIEEWEGVWSLIGEVRVSQKRLLERLSAGIMQEHSGKD